MGHGHSFVERNRRRLEEALIIAFLFALPLLFFWRQITPAPLDRASFRAGDFTGQYFPLHVFAARELLAGRLPLWNPYLYGGQPALADIQSGVFYPLNLLTVLVLWLFGGDYTLFVQELQVIFHFSLAGLFTYLFMRRKGGRLGGLISALTFTYGGYLTSFPVQQMTMLEVAVWLPLILLFLDKALSPASRPWIIWAGAALGVALLAGHPQTALYLFYTALGYLLFRLWATPPFIPPLAGGQRGVRPFLSAAFPFLLFVPLGLGLAAVQIWPTLEFIRFSSRAQLGYKAVSWGLPLNEIIALFYPGFLGGSPQYVGVLPLILAVMAVLWGRKAGPDAPPSVQTSRERFFWLGLALLSLLLSLGGNTFLFSFFYLLVPGFGAVRDQERALFLFSFSLAMLAGYGAVLLRPSCREELLTLRRWVGRVGWAALAFTGALYYGWVRAAHAGAEVNVFEGALRHHVLNLLILGGALLLLTLCLHGRGGWGGALAVALTLFQLFTVNWRYNLKEAPLESFFPRTELTEFLGHLPGRGRISSAGLLPGGASAGAVYELEDITGNSPLHLAAFEKFTAQVGEWRRWQLLHVTHILDRRALDGPGLRRLYECEDEEGKIRVYEITDPLPRAWVVHRAQVAASEEEAWAILNAGHFNLKESAVLEEEPEIALPASDEVAGESAVSLAERGPTHLTLEVETPANSLLVLSEIYYPGWQARVDGRPAPLYRANRLLRAVPLEAGHHRVEIRYDPLSFKGGLGLTALTVMAAAALLFAKFATL